MSSVTKRDDLNVSENDMNETNVSENNVNETNVDQHTSENDIIETNVDVNETKDIQCDSTSETVGGGALPTLLIRGKLHSDDPVERERLSKYIPIEYILQWFEERLSKFGVENRFLVLKSETASGKSTLLPPRLYKFVRRGGPGIICTQPRVITTIENVKQILEHNPQMRLGQNIGWSTKHDKLRSAQYGLLSATVGTLTQQLKSYSDEEIKARYKFILIDETHERDLHTDLCLMLLKKFLKRNQHSAECPFVVLMSATIDPGLFLRYFLDVDSQSASGGPESVASDTTQDTTSAVSQQVESRKNFIHCRGEAAGFTEKWPEGVIHDYRKEIVKIVERISTNTASDASVATTKDTNINANVNAKVSGIAQSDILVFLPGNQEILECYKQLVSLNKKLPAEAVFSLLKLDGISVKKNTRDVKLLTIPLKYHSVHRAGKTLIPVRRVILSTSVAETGLTLNDLKYVIDVGMDRSIEYSARDDITALLTKPASWDRIEQRRGRAGRKFPGVFYPLYPVSIYKQLEKQQLPSILTSDISPVILDIILACECEDNNTGESFENKSSHLETKSFHATRDAPHAVFRLRDIEMVNNPTRDAIQEVIIKLIALGFVRVHDSETLSLTSEGRHAAELSYPGLLPEHLRMILSSYYHKIHLYDILSCIAWIQNPISGVDWSYVYGVAFPRHSAEEVQSLFSCNWVNGVVLAAALENTNFDEFQARSGIARESLIYFVKDRDTLAEHLLQYAFQPHGNTLEPSPAYITRLKHCILEGYRQRLIHFQSIGEKLTFTYRGRECPGDFHSAIDKLKLKQGYIACSQFGTKYNIQSDSYTIALGQTSLLTGYIGVDSNFLG